MPSVSSGVRARCRLSESSSRLTRSGSGQASAKASLMGPTAAGVAWMRAMRVMPLRYHHITKRTKLLAVQRGVHVAFELFDLTGNRALVTGSSQGIGFA